MGKTAVILLLLYVLMEFYIAIDIKDGERTRNTLSLIVEITLSVIAALCCILPFNKMPLVIVVGIFLLIHILSRVGKFIVSKVLKRKIPAIVFILRQCVMIIIVFVLSWLYSMAADSGIRIILGDTGLPFWMILKVLLAVLLITKPVNDMFRVLFPNLKPPDIGRVNKKLSSINVGALIGSMERVLILISLMAGEFLGIGFVFTAKSISRYKRISMQREFAEYYLLGTLYSILAALAVYGLVFVIL